MRIIDLSNNNGDLVPIVHAAKRAGITGAIFKITEGQHFVDARAKAGIAAARKLGLRVGGYHFARETDPRAEARHYVGHAHAAGLWHKGDFRPQLDFEVGPTSHASPWRDAFQDEVYRVASGAHTGLYTFPAFNPVWLRPKRFLMARVWAAGFPSLRVPNGYKASDVWLHQFTPGLPLGAAARAALEQGAFLHELGPEVEQLKGPHEPSATGLFTIPRRGDEPAGEDPARTLSRGVGAFRVDCSTVLGRVPAVTLRANVLTRAC